MNTSLRIANTCVALLAVLAISCCSGTKTHDPALTSMITERPTISGDWIPDPTSTGGRFDLTLTTPGPFVEQKLRWWAGVDNVLTQVPVGPATGGPITIRTATWSTSALPGGAIVVPPKPARQVLLFELAITRREGHTELLYAEIDARIATSSTINELMYWSFHQEGEPIVPMPHPEPQPMVGGKIGFTRAKVPGKPDEFVFDAPSTGIPITEEPNYHVRGAALWIESFDPSAASDRLVVQRPRDLGAASAQISVPETAKSAVLTTLVAERSKVELGCEARAVLIILVIANGRSEYWRYVSDDLVSRAVSSGKMSDEIDPKFVRVVSAGLANPVTGGEMTALGSQPTSR